MKGSRTMLHFEVAAGDSITFPADAVTMIDSTGAAAGVIYAEGGATAGGPKVIKITFNSASNSIEKCCKELAKVFALSDPGLVVVADTTAGFTHKACPNLVLTNLAIAINQ